MRGKDDAVHKKATFERFDWQVGTGSALGYTNRTNGLLKTRLKLPRHLYLYFEKSRQRDTGKQDSSQIVVLKVLQIS